MKFSSFCLGLSVLLSAVALNSAQTVSGVGKPGYCQDSTKCAASYSCVSVQTTRAGITNVKQCLPMASSTPVCTGTSPGLCPSFSTTWGTAFREISSVCAYIAPETTGGKCLTAAAATSNNATLTKGGLQCLFVEDPSNKTVQIGVIYGCVDFDGTRLLFEKNTASDKLASKFNYSEAIAEKCVNPKNPQGSSFVCSSQGTCAPKSGGTMDYACSCNVGFSGKYCEKIVNNKCYNDGVCGGGSCDLATNECTNCPAGTLGDKCAQCDPTFDATKVCGGHGKCVTASGTSTLGAADSSAASETTAPPANTDGSSTAGTATPTITRPPTSSNDGSAASATVTAPATIRPSNGTRFLASAMYQCECATGFSDVHCGVVVQTNSSKVKSTLAPPTDSSVTSLVVPAVGIALSTAIAMLSL